MRNIPNTTPLKLRNGFSLVDVMVGMVIGLLTMLVIMQSYAAFEGQKRTTTTGMEALENGLLALHAVETDVRQAGYGLTTSGFLPCTSVNTYDSAATPTIANVPLLPNKITDGGTGSDTIITTYSTSATGGIPAHIVVPMPNSSAVLTISPSATILARDILFLATPGSGLPCSRVVATSSNMTANGLNVVHNSGLSNFNTTAATNFFPTAGYGTSSVVFNMGKMVQNQYQILCGSLTATDLTTVTAASAGCTNSSSFSVGAVAISSNIVRFKAEYGISGTVAGNQQVSCWTPASGVACSISGSSWDTPPAADVARIKAIRVAVVARSSLKERPPSAGATCNATPNTSAPNYPQWAGGAIDVTGITDWQCYRYKVFETIIPLRNILWANI